MAPPEAEMRDPVLEPVHELAIEKAEHDHVEESKGDLGDVPPQSPFKDMSRRKAIRVFWKVCLFSFLVAWTAITDGFLITSVYKRLRRKFVDDYR